MKTFFKNPCNLYVLLWCLQMVHTPLKLYGDALSVIVLFVLYLWSFGYFIAILRRPNNPPFLAAWNLMYILFMLYGIYDMLVLGSHSRLYIMAHSTSMLPLYPFYVYAEKGYLTKVFFKRWAIVLLPVAMANFILGQQMALQNILSEEVEGVTNNMGYSIAFMMPFFYFWRKTPIVQYLGFGALTILTILALKRGAIIVVVLSLLLLILHEQRKNKGASRFISIFMGITFVCCIAFFLQKQATSNAYMMTRLEQTESGDNSARGEIYSEAWSFFENKMEPIEVLFGMGANGCVKAINTEAHNDWLEVLISMGLLGFLAFLRIWINAYRDYQRITSPEIKFLFGLVILTLFARTFFSMSIGDMYFYSTCIMGYCLANKCKKIN